MKFKSVQINMKQVSYIQNGGCDILNSQQIMIKFALQLFACKCLSFQTHLLLDLRFARSKLKKKKLHVD